MDNQTNFDVVTCNSRILCFYAIKALYSQGVPCVPLEEYNKHTKLSNDKLWTVRTSPINQKGVYGDTPKLIGKKSEYVHRWIAMCPSAYKFFYYPYFIAEKSGLLYIHHRKITIEATKGDLWNLTDNHNCVECITVVKNDQQIIGETEFLTSNEIQSILKYVPYFITQREISFQRGNQLQVEWSFAYDSDLDKHPVGNPHLLFYGFRDIKL